MARHLLLSCVLVGVGAGTAHSVTGTAQIATSLSSENLGSVVLGSSSQQTFTVSDKGTANLVISALNVSGSVFKVSSPNAPLTIAPGKTTSVLVVFTPSSVGSAAATLTIASNAPSAKSVSLKGTGVPALSFIPSTVNFNSVTVGSSSRQSVTVKNGSKTAVTVSKISISGSTYKVSGATLPLTIAANGSTSFVANFLPPFAGNFYGSISLVSNSPGPPSALRLSGAGAAAAPTLTVNPATLNLGTVDVGSDASQTVSLRNTGNSNVTISQLTASGAGFSATGAEPNEIVTAGESVSLNVTFAPKSAGNATGTVSVSSNATNSPATVGLSGSGATANSHSVSLSWNASTSPVDGYDIYRGTVSGGPYAVLLNSSPVSALKFTDTNVTAGQTYYYVVVAVGTNGVDSNDSNQATATIP